MKNRIMTTHVKKLNTLVTEIFGDIVGNIDERWTSNPEVQKTIRSLCVAKTVTVGKKDPNAPKRGKSAYLFFCAANRTQVKSDLGSDAKATEVTKELGARWNALKSSNKAADKKALAEYEKAASDDKSRYESEKEEYVPPVSEEGEVTRSGKRGGKKTVQQGPKRSKSAYLFFCADNRDAVKTENPEMKATEITAELGRRWNELKDNESRVEELKKYEDQAEQDKLRYESEKAGGVKLSTQKSKKATKKSDTTQKQTKTTATEEEDVGTKTSKSKVKSKVKTPKAETTQPTTTTEKQTGDKTSNGYQAFCTARRPELKEQFPKAKATEITKKLSVAWKNLSKEEQEEWKNEAATASA
jgi:hypothetical protein